MKEDNKLAKKNTSVLEPKKKMKRSMLEKKKQSQERRRTSKEAVGSESVVLGTTGVAKPHDKPS